MGPGIEIALAGITPEIVTVPDHGPNQGPGHEADHGVGHNLGLDLAVWQRAAVRVGEYLAAMGLQDNQEIEQLLVAVRGRLESRLAMTPLEDPVESAIEETHTLLDQWLTAELGLEAEPNTLCAARAAVLGGGLPGWSARWAGLSEHSLAPEIRSLCIPAVPEPAPLSMEPNPIDLFLHRLADRIHRAISRLLPRSLRHEAKTRGHP